MAEWQVTAERVLRQYRARGLNIRKVEIDLDDLLVYCGAEGRPNDAAARSAPTWRTSWSVGMMKQITSDGGAPTVPRPSRATRWIPQRPVEGRHGNTIRPSVAAIGHWELVIGQSPRPS